MGWMVLFHLLWHPWGPAHSRGFLKGIDWALGNQDLKGTISLPAFLYVFFLLLLLIVFLLCLGVWSHWHSSTYHMLIFSGLLWVGVNCCSQCREGREDFYNFMTSSQVNRKRAGLCFHCIFIFSAISWCPQVAWLRVPCSTVFYAKSEDSPGLFHQRLL